MLFVRVKGLEPSRLTSLDPKSSAATNYATPAAFSVCGHKDKLFLFRLKVSFACQLFRRYDLACGLDDGVRSVGRILLFHVAEDIGSDTELYLVLLSIQHGRSGETDAPSVRQLGGVWQSASATGLITHYSDILKIAHAVDEVVRGAERVAVGQHHGGFLPADAV